jgi:hypothetical protein
MAMNNTGYIEDFRIVTHPALLNRGRRRATGGRVKDRGFAITSSSATNAQSVLTKQASYSHATHDYP